MPAQRLNVTFEPRPLQALYSKYAPERRSDPSLVVSLPAAASRVRVRPGPDAPPKYPRRQELGDLRKLGKELTKVERVHMYLQMSNGTGICESKNRVQTKSAGVDLRSTAHQCRRCSREHEKDDGKNRMQDLKSKLKLVAARSLPDCGRDRDISPTRSTTNNSQRVVPLPTLQLNMNLKRNAKSSEDIAALRETHQSIRSVFYPVSVSRRVWNYRRNNGSLPNSRGYSDVSDMSGGHAAGVCLPPATQNNPTGTQHNKIDLFSDTASSYDADRVDSEQFGYVFDNFSESSTDSDTTLTDPEFDTGTASARAQRPSTTDTVPTPQRLVETRASAYAPPTSPLVSPRAPSAKYRGGEAWPPQYTVVPSWPALDDPYRFQFRGCNVHKDIMRKLHKSRGKRRQARKGNEVEQSQPQKLKVVVPSHINTECAECRLYGIGHHPSTPCPPNTPLPASAAATRCGTAFAAAKSAKSRSSLAMSVCTLHSWRSKSQLKNGISNSACDQAVTNETHTNGVDKTQHKDQKGYPQ